MKLIRYPFVTVAMIALSLALPGTTSEQELSGRGSISGVVKYEGEVPAPQKLEVNKDLEICGQHDIFSERLIVSATGRLKNVFVQVLGAKGEVEIPETRVSVAQQGCRFVPHVQVIPAGTRMNVLNKDGIAHNIHTLSVENPSFNRLQPGIRKRMVTRKNDLAIPEIIPLKCDLHGWMNAWIIVVDHPYHALSDDEGGFKISSIPAGTYTAEFWHETLGKQTQEVTVEAGANTEVKVVFKSGK